MEPSVGPFSKQQNGFHKALAVSIFALSTSVQMDDLARPASSCEKATAAAAVWYDLRKKHDCWIFLAGVLALVCMSAVAVAVAVGALKLAIAYGPSLYAALNSGAYAAVVRLFWPRESMYEITGLATSSALEDHFLIYIALYVVLVGGYGRAKLTSASATDATMARSFPASASNFPATARSGLASAKTLLGDVLGFFCLVFGTTFANRAAGKLLAQRIAAAQEPILGLRELELSSGPLPAPTRLRTIRLYSRPRAETWG